MTHEQTLLSPYLQPHPRGVAGGFRTGSQLQQRTGAARRLRNNGRGRLWVTVRRAVWLLGLALFAGPAMADGIVADGAANPALRPEVINTQNGLPQVNITAPNRAGITSINSST